MNDSDFATPPMPGLESTDEDVDDLKTMLSMLIKSKTNKDLDEFDNPTHAMGVYLTAEEAEMNELREKVAEKDDEIKLLRAEIRKTKNTRPGTKKEHAKQISATTIIKEAGPQLGSGLTGACATAKLVNDVVSGDNSVDYSSFNHAVIYSAWEALEDEWYFLKVREGSGHKHGKPKALIADVDEIPRSFIDSYAEDV